MNSSGAPFSICFQAILDSLFGEYLTKYYHNFVLFSIIFLGTYRQSISNGGLFVNGSLQGPNII